MCIVVYFDILFENSMRFMKNNYLFYFDLICCLGESESVYI